MWGYFFLFFFNTIILALLVKDFFFICLLYFLSLVDKGAFDINEHAHTENFKCKNKVLGQF